jgi:hypothetical protein
MYTLTYDMDSGMWSSAFMPATMEIMGTGLMAMSREADKLHGRQRPELHVDLRHGVRNVDGHAYDAGCGVGDAG